MRHQCGLSLISYSSLTEELHISRLTSATTMGVMPWIIFGTIGLRLCVVIKNTFSWKDTPTLPHHVHCSIIYNSPEQPVCAHGWVDKENVIYRVCVCVHAYMLSCFSCAQLWPYGLHPARLLCPWDFPGKNTSGLPCPPPGDLPHPGIRPGSLALLADSLPLSHQGSPCVCVCVCACVRACVCVTYMPIIQPVCVTYMPIIQPW